MTLKYVRTRADFGYNLYGEFGYEDKEKIRFFKIIEKLKKIGWEIDISVENKVACAVRNKDEFENLKRAWKGVRHITK